VLELHRGARLVVLWRLHDGDRLAVRRWSLLAWRHCRVHELQCWLRVSSGVDERDASSGDVWRRRLRAVRRDVVQRVQCRVRVPAGV
jgi:hypothetical protein